MRQLRASGWTGWSGWIAAMALCACGGGGSDGEVVPTAVAAGQGKFVDGPVSGLAYICGAHHGVTSAAGEFNYIKRGDACVFKIGGITLGSALVANVLTPVDLVAEAKDETDPAVINMARLLLSLDADGDASNGLSIDEAASDRLAMATLDFRLDAAAFETQAETLVGSAIIGRALVSSDQACAHLKASLLALLAGDYKCSYEGSDPYFGSNEGTASISIAQGTIVGQGMPTKPAGPTFEIRGDLTSTGTARLSTGGVTSTGAVFDGAFEVDGTGAGGWTDGKFAEGNWSCTKG